ncbi:MAG: hypothetical protein ACTIJJ_13505 [Galactobacter sp.]
MNRLTVRSALALTAAALGVAATGCSGSDPGPTSDETVPWISFERSAPGGDDALISGTLVEKSGCLAVEIDGGDDATFLAFSTSDPRPEKLEVGDSFKAGGGFHAGEEALSDRDYVFPESCAEGIVELAVIALE